jgi:ABC-type uncharacterized transport system YnjBCD substrate-binding protein
MKQYMVNIQKRIDENTMVVGAKRLNSTKDPVVHMSDLKPIYQYLEQISEYIGMKSKDPVVHMSDLKAALDPINKRLDYLTKLLIDHINKSPN